MPSSLLFLRSPSSSSITTMASSLLTRPLCSSVEISIEHDKTILPFLDLCSPAPRTFLIITILQQQIKFYHPSSEDYVYMHQFDPLENSYLAPTTNLHHVKNHLSLCVSDIPFCPLDDKFVEQSRSLLYLQRLAHDPHTADNVVAVRVELNVVTGLACWESDVPSIMSYIHSSRKQPKQVHTSVLQLYAMKRRSEVSNPDDQCVVCFEEFGSGSSATSLPCSHMFHSRCIWPWLDNNLSCPLCRSPLTDLTVDNIKLN